MICHGAIAPLFGASFGKKLFKLLPNDIEAPTGKVIIPYKIEKRGSPGKDAVFIYKKNGEPYIVNDDGTRGTFVKIK